MNSKEKCESKLLSLIASRNLVDSVKNVPGKRHVLKLHNRKDVGALLGFRVNELVKLTAARSRERYELVRCLYSYKAHVQGIGSQVVSIREIGERSVEIILSVQRIPNISKGATGVEMALHPDYTFKEPLQYRTEKFITLGDMFVEHTTFDAFSILFETAPIYYSSIELMGGMEYLNRMYFEDCQGSEYVEGLKQAYKRVLYYKSVSRYE